MKDSANLTDQQWDLLRVLVSGHESYGGAEFYFGCNVGGCGITYSGGRSIPGVYDETDLLQLRRERFVNITRPQRNLHRGKPTQLGIATLRRHLVEPAKQAIAADSEFWRKRREELESLPSGEYSLIWSTCPPVSLDGKLLPSQWSWWRFPDVSIRARLSAIALKCAKGLGHDSEDGWFDRLRTADFVKFRLTGAGRQRQPDRSMVDYESGVIKDIVKHSITLCHILEAGGSLTPSEPIREPRAIDLNADGSNLPRRSGDAILNGNGDAETTIAPQDAADRKTSDLPALSEPTKRILDLRWQQLLETHGLDGDAVRSYAGAGEMTRKYALAKPLDSSYAKRKGFSGYLANYLSSRRQCGISPSEDLAKAWFQELAKEYRTHCAPAMGTNSLSANFNS
jgi:hypothetical protein